MNENRRYPKTMSVEMNESYNRCLEELRARYKGRGIAGNIKKQNAI